MEDALKRAALEALGATPAPPPEPAEEAQLARVASAVTAFVAAALGPAVRTTYGELCPVGAVDAAEVAASGDDPVVRRFVSGGGIYRFSYDVYLRRCVRSAGARIDALGLLGGLAGLIEGGACPEAPGVSWVSHGLARSPALYSVDADGNETYRLAASLTYLVPSE